jgi:hypothetical protein
MKIWTVTFNGLYPVGACAIVHARTERAAIERVKARWTREYPFAKMADNFEARQFDPAVETCHIIMNGDY